MFVQVLNHLSFRYSLPNQALCLGCEAVDHGCTAIDNDITTRNVAFHLSFIRFKDVGIIAHQVSKPETLDFEDIFAGLRHASTQ